jgi:hypothetical protein
MQTTELQVELGQEWPKVEGVVFCAPQHGLVEFPA